MATDSKSAVPFLGRAKQGCFTRFSPHTSCKARLRIVRTSPRNPGRSCPDFLDPRKHLGRGVCSGSELFISIYIYIYIYVYTYAYIYIYTHVYRY